MTLKNKLAEKHLFNSFVNSLCRDYSRELGIKVNSDKAIIPINVGEYQLPIERYSILGNNRFSSRVIFVKEGSETEVAHTEFYKSLIQTHFPEYNVELFFESMEHSRLVLERILNERFEERDKWNLDNFDYLRSEQSLILGHPFHPFPKARLGMNQVDERSFSPEYGSKFKLVWLYLSNDRLYQASSDFTNKRWHHDLFIEDCQLNSKELKKGFSPIPFHPWQWEKVKNDSWILSLLESQELIVYGSGAHDWHATSSLRSVYCKELDKGLKFSLSVKLTNSIRHLGESELIRGIQVDHVLNDELCAPFLKEHPHFGILKEAACLGILDRNNKPMENTFILSREGMGEFGAKDKNLHLLSTLTQDNPWGGASPLANLALANAQKAGIPYMASAKAWLSTYFDVCLWPILDLACNYGVLLGAHMQNVLLEVDGFLPKSARFRDCQGSGFTALGFEKFASSCDLIQKDNGNVLDGKSAQAIFLYYLIVNNLFGVVSALASDSEDADALELSLLSLVKGRLFQKRSDGVLDLELFDAFYLSKNLLQKGNFRCSLQWGNENTMADPASLYNEVENPLGASLREPIPFSELRAFEKELASGVKISLRPFDLSKDLETFYQWHQKDYIDEFWEMKQSKEELGAYILGLTKSYYQSPMIFEVDGISVGYFEVYWAFDDRIAPYCSPEVHDCGIHLLIGNESYLKTRYVLDSINLVSEYIFQKDEKTKRIWAEPRHDNTKIIRISQRLPGWTFIKEFDFPHKRSALLVNERDVFEAEFKTWKL